jgi:hypothetical protein
MRLFLSGIRLSDGGEKKEGHSLAVFMYDHQSLRHGGKLYAGLFRFE